MVFRWYHLEKKNVNIILMVICACVNFEKRIIKPALMTIASFSEAISESKHFAKNDKNVNCKINSITYKRYTVLFLFSV